MKKRILAVMLTICILLTMAPAVFAQDSSTATWTVADGVMTVSGSGEMFPSDGPRPDGWPSGSGITTIIIQEGITEINAFAFDGYSELNRVMLADSVEEVGYAAFQNCTALEQVTMPYDIRVGKDAFLNTPWLDALPSENGFTIHNGVLLRYNGEDTAIVIPNTATTIAGDFSDTALESVIIPDSVTALSDYCFYLQTNLMQVNLPGSLIYIGDYAFERTALTNVVVPESVKYLGDGAFYDCTSLLTASLPDSLTYVGDTLFQDCGKLTTVTLPDNIPGIPEDMFNRCYKLTGVVLPDSVTYIGENAFARCYALTEINIPAGVTSIGYDAFWDCYNLTSIDLPESLVDLSAYAFNGCSGLATIRFPGTIKFVMDYESFSDTPWMAKQYDENGFAVVKGWLLSYNGSASEITIPGSVTHIAGGAFSACDSVGEITAVTIPDTVVYIGSRAFYGMSGLADIVIPDGVTFIGYYAFANCSGLRKVRIPDSVTTMEYGMFRFCTNLSEVTLSANLTEIPDETFLYCPALTSIEIPGSVASIGNKAFFGCTDMDSITVPATVTEIGHMALGYYEDDSYYTDELIRGFKICGFTGSAAQSYASENGIRFTALDDSGEGPDPTDPDDPPVVDNPFTDVPATEYYAEPVAWAVELGITVGTSDTTFGPTQECTRAQIVTFLWRAAGEPEPETVENPFSDVTADDYFYKAVLWAVENEITVGMGDGTFGSEATCTRAQVATFLWRTAGEPEGAGANPFTDVPNTEYYAEPVIWAVANGITQGDGLPTTFNPDGKCTRAQIVTFLYRFSGE